MQGWNHGIPHATPCPYRPHARTHGPCSPKPQPTVGSQILLDILHHAQCCAGPVMSPTFIIGLEQELGDQVDRLALEAVERRLVHHM